MSDRSPFPAIPEPTTDPVALVKVSRAMKEILELMLGRRGNSAVALAAAPAPVAVPGSQGSVVVDTAAVDTLRGIVALQAINGAGE